MKTRALFAKIATVSLLGAGLMSQVVCAQGIGGNQPSFVPGRILVKFKDGVSDGQARRVLAGRNALSTDVIPQIGVHIVQLPPNANEQAEANAFKGLKDVEFAEVDGYLQPQSISPNDYYYVQGYQWSLPKISAPDAWSVTTGSSAITIAIIDMGVDGSHPDLTAKMVPGWNIYSNDSFTGMGQDPTTGLYWSVSHGTMTAGVAAATTNNASGIAGVCWGCMIMPVRVSDQSGGATLSNIASGITWAADHGARVVNSGYQLTGSSVASSAAQYLMGKGGILTAPAGDYSYAYTYPDDPSILEIGSTDQNDVVYSWSDTGAFVDMVAPGYVATTYLSGSYQTGYGTSFSSPQVAGVAALMLSVNPGLTPTQIVNMLKQTAVDLGTAGCDTIYGCGRLNALAAVTAAAGGSTKTNTTTALSSSLSTSTYGQTVTFTATVSPSAATGTVTFLDGSTALGTGTLSSGVAAFSTSALAVGIHSIKATYAGNTSYNSSTSAILSQTVNTTSKTSTTTSLTSSLNPSTNGQTVTFTATVSSSAATGTVTFYDGGGALGSAAVSSGIARLSTSGLSVGTHSITASYGGDSTYNGSTSSVLSQAVNSTTITDTTAPTAPTNLTDPGMTSSQISLAWTGSTDNVGVKGYQIYRAKKNNGKGNKYSSFSLIGTSSTTGYTDRSVSSGGAYEFYVKAYDAAGNVSAASNMIAVTAP